MTPKEFILQIPKAEKMIARKQEEIERLKSVAEGLSGSGNQERIGNTKSAGKMENAIIKYISREEEIENDISENEEIKKYVMQTIESLGYDQYDIVCLKYLNKDRRTGEYKELTLGEIAILKGKSYSWVTKIHSTAMEHLESIISQRQCKTCAYSTSTAFGTACYYIEITGKPRNCMGGNGCAKYKKRGDGIRKEKIKITKKNEEERRRDNEYRAYEFQAVEKRKK